MALLTGTGGGFADRGAVGPASQCGEHLVPVESGMSWGWEQPFGLTSPRMLKFCSLEQWCYSLRYRPSAVTGWGGCSINLGAGDMGDPAQRAAAGRGGLRAPLCHVLPARALGHMEAGGLGLEPCRLGESGE